MDLPSTKIIDVDITLESFKRIARVSHRELDNRCIGTSDRHDIPHTHVFQHVGHLVQVVDWR